MAKGSKEKVVVSGCLSSVAERWQLKSEASGIRFDSQRHNAYMKLGVKGISY